MAARQHPLILNGTCPRMSKLKDTGPTAAVRIKMCGTKEELATAMVNPFHAQQGGSFNLGKALKKVAKGAKAAAPYVSAASGAAILAGTVTGQPEVVALGAAGKAASKLAGGAKKKPPMKPARYRLSQDPTQI